MAKFLFYQGPDSTVALECIWSPIGCRPIPSSQTSPNFIHAIWYVTTCMNKPNPRRRRRRTTLRSSSQMHRRDSPKLRPPDIYLSEWEGGRGGKTCLIPHQENLRSHRSRKVRSVHRMSDVKTQTGKDQRARCEQTRRKRGFRQYLPKLPKPLTNRILRWILLVEIHTLKGHGFQAELLQ